MEFRWLRLIILLFFLFSCTTGEIVTTPHDRALAVRIIDGDTLLLDTGDKVRLLGINTPESWEAYYEEATKALSGLVLNKTLVLVRDTTERDKYHRLLRYVYLEDGLFVNLEMVRTGWARAYLYPPDDQHYEEFAVLEQQSQSNNIGLWNLTGLEQIVQIAYPVGCNYVASQKGDVYYAIKCKYAHRILPANQVCFTTAEEAEQAGYRVTQKC